MNGRSGERQIRRREALRIEKEEGDNKEKKKKNTRRQ